MADKKILAAGLRPAAFFFLLFLFPFSLQAQLPGRLFVPKPSLTITTPPSAIAGESFLIHAQVVLPAGYYQDRKSDFLRFEVSAPLENLDLQTSEPTLRAGKESFTGTFSLDLKVRVPLQTPPGLFSGKISLEYQICQIDGVCLLPAEMVQTLTITLKPPLNPLPSPPPATRGLPLDFGSLFFNLLLALGGGFLLNLMPCVFPVLSIKALQAARSANQQGRFRAESLLFSSGVIFSFLLLAGFVLLLRALGASPSWGFYFQNPLFVWVLSLLFWLGALSLWGLVQFRGISFSSLPAIPGKASLAASFAAGVLEVLAAAPCTAPLLGPALGYAFALPSFFLFPFFLTAGIGLALPHLALAAFPGLGRLLPKPGAWLESFERLMGFFLAATVIYLLFVLNSQLGTVALFKTLTVCLVLAAALLFSQNIHVFNQNRLGRFLRLVSILLLLAGGAFWSLEEEASAKIQTPTTNDGWVAFSKSGLEKSLAEGKTVFIDATAAWCATCQVNEALVLSRHDVIAAFEKSGIVKMKADYTRPDPAIALWLEEVGRAGLPVYAIYKPHSKPLLLPELLNAEELKFQLTKF